MPIVSTPHVDIRHAALLATRAGGLLWAMANGYAIIAAPVFPGMGVVIRCVAESACGVAAAAICGIFISPGICVFMHVTDVQLVSIIGVGVGLIAWVVTPKVIAALSKIAVSRIEKVGEK